MSFSTRAMDLRGEYASKYRSMRMKDRFEYTYDNKSDNKIQLSDKCKHVRTYKYAYTSYIII